MATKFLLLVFFGALIACTSNARRVVVEEKGAPDMEKTFWPHFPHFGSGGVGFGGGIGWLGGGKSGGLGGGDSGGSGDGIGSGIGGLGGGGGDGKSGSTGGGDGLP
ncbi:glycine-rich protein 5-like [Actinidia eriantha]|uniref:glycine-rich protein 5-like n=1 Tax=Actinidia eriantha TaxID=165200 RepID=UPI002588687B|nr:glycine-rich protein 5-like [Actinidia eriantha]